MIGWIEKRPVISQPDRMTLARTRSVPAFEQRHAFPSAIGATIEHALGTGPPAGQHWRSCSVVFAEASGDEGTNWSDVAW